MILYRPVGIEELRLIYDTGLKAFPPRLPDQPIFYPVLNREYARQIARDWNTKSGSRAGYVTQFAVDDIYVSHFEPHQVGASQHIELWVPADQLDEFNQHIAAPITAIDAFFGDNFDGYIPSQGGMKGKTAREQFAVMVRNHETGAGMEFMEEIGCNHQAIFLHYSFWRQHDFSAMGIDLEIQTQILTLIRDLWYTTRPTMPLCDALQNE